MFFKFFFNIVFILFIFSCSGNPENKNSEFNNKDITDHEIQFVKAMEKFNNQQIDEAILIFNNIEKIYPLSNEAIQSQIMSGYIDYLRLEYDSAILKFNRIIARYPSLKNIDYVYYMRAISYYEQITHEGLDGEYNLLALENLMQVVNRFPDSKYSKDSYQKIILVKSNIAAKNMTIGRFYQKEKKYTAALNRYKIVVNDFAETKFISEALYRIAEIYLSIGMEEDSRETAAILGYNYPDSEWYKKIYEKLNKKNKESFFKKILNK